MKTILTLTIPDATDSDEVTLTELIKGEIDRCKKAGDLLGMGEWLAANLAYLPENELEATFARLIGLWGSPGPLSALPSSIDELVARLEELRPESVSLALARAVLSFRSHNRSVPPGTERLAFRLEGSLRHLFALPEVGVKKLPAAAATRLGETWERFDAAVGSFLKSDSQSASQAKESAIRVIRTGRDELKKLLLPAEGPFLTDVELVLGVPLRNFCDACSRLDTEQVLRQAAGLRETAQRFVVFDRDSTLWRGTVKPVAQHVLKLVDGAVQQNRTAASPSLRLATAIAKVDLAASDREISFSCRLRNVGEGQAYDVCLVPLDKALPVSLRVGSPRCPFDLPGKSDQIITFALTSRKPAGPTDVPLVWQCKTLMGEAQTETTVLRLEQQSVEPDWNALEEDPPYSLRPVRRADQLFGRAGIRKELLLNAAQGKSTFLWGQKRVGKTSLLQVLVSELRQRPCYVCVSLRMGELRALHEGKVAHTIATRIHQEASLPAESVPPEEFFGAGLGRLIPFVERFIRQHPDRKLLCVIDEFDDFDPAFYIGERGKQFVKALRSLAETGLTFFFAGSERMNAIYKRHQLDLNVWANLYLDRIESREDCKELVARPVRGKIEYQSECVAYIVGYCDSNPFYMHLFCSKILANCMQERRTFIGETDLPLIQERLLREVAEANFAHFWEDNPDLDESDRIRHAAENCLVLACVGGLAGAACTADDLSEAQEKLDLNAIERPTAHEFHTIIERLRARRVLVPDGRKLLLALPMFRDWLVQRSQPLLLNRWREYRREAQKHPIAAVTTALAVSSDSSFPITEDDLLAVSENLIYCGKQKDVAELRVWLKQFDDDVRIELAFQLLKRLAEKGYVSEGARTHSLGKLEEMIKSLFHKLVFC